MQDFREVRGRRDRRPSGLIDPAAAEGRSLGSPSIFTVQDKA
jgi:hypothetical protein